MSWLFIIIVTSAVLVCAFLSWVVSDWIQFDKELFAKYNDFYRDLYYDGNEN